MKKFLIYYLKTHFKYRCKYLKSIIYFLIGFIPSVIISRNIAITINNYMDINDRISNQLGFGLMLIINLTLLLLPIWKINKNLSLNYCLNKKNIILIMYNIISNILSIIILFVLDIILSSLIFYILLLD